MTDRNGMPIHSGCCQWPRPPLAMPRYASLQPIMSQWKPTTTIMQHWCKTLLQRWYVAIKANRQQCWRKIWPRQPWLSISGELQSWSTHIQTSKSKGNQFKRQSGKQTDRHNWSHYCPVNAVGNNWPLSHGYGADSPTKNNSSMQIFWMELVPWSWLNKIKMAHIKSSSLNLICINERHHTI